MPYRENNRFKIFLLTLDEVDSSNKTLIIRKHPDGKFDTTITYPDKFHKNKLITHTTEAGFDSILFSDARQMLEGTNAQFQKMYKWSENEVALCSIAYGTKQDSSTMLIYNIDTKEWNKFILPDFIVFTPFGVIDNELISISEWNNRHYFLTRSKLYVYEPNNSIEDNTEPAIIKNYSLFPNPAGDDCTLSMDLAEAGSISISLSDMLGRDIMQIYDGYADAGAFTKAFNTKHLACGVYSVIIRIGDKINVEKLIINR